MMLYQVASAAEVFVPPAEVLVPPVPSVPPVPPEPWPPPASGPRPPASMNLSCEALAAKASSFCVLNCSRRASHSGFESHSN